MYVRSLIKDLRWTGSAVHTFHRLSCAINEYCGIVILQRTVSSMAPKAHSSQSNGRNLTLFGHPMPRQS
jgi:hypothetical protein